MKATGYVRKVDTLGRIVLPKKLRMLFDLNVEDYVYFSSEEDTIVIEKYHPPCVFCNSKEDTMEIKGKVICMNCLRELQNK